jgi:hypothetical protein
MSDDTDAVVAAAREYVTAWDERASGKAPPGAARYNVAQSRFADIYRGFRMPQAAHIVVALADQRDEAQAEVTRLRTAVEGVKREHAAEMCVNGERWCDTCETGWPCPTIEALGDEGPS